MVNGLANAEASFWSKGSCHFSVPHMAFSWGVCVGVWGEEGTEGEVVCWLSVSLLTRTLIHWTRALTL